MKSFSRQLAGLKAKKEGQAFESLFEVLCAKEGIAVTRIPDSCRVIGANRYVRVKSPFDWVISCKGSKFLIDTKSVAGSTIPYSLIDEFQVSEMAKHAGDFDTSGYVVWLRETDRIVFIPTRILKQCLGKRGSIQPEKGKLEENMDLGTSKNPKMTNMFWS